MTRGKRDEQMALGENWVSFLSGNGFCARQTVKKDKTRKEDLKEILLTIKNFTPSLAIFFSNCHKIS